MSEKQHTHAHISPVKISHTSIYSHSILIIYKYTEWKKRRGNCKQESVHITLTQDFCDTYCNVTYGNTEFQREV